MARRFACTACGKCCHGALPLTIDEALAQAGRFPLAVSWVPVRKGHKAFDITARLGTLFRLRDKRDAAVRVMPVAHLPPALACPALAVDGLCSIHATKPLRCRAMPFFAARDEADQTELLVPRAGWACDTSEAAPVVYGDKDILDRADFDAERGALLAQAPVIKAYADKLMATAPGLAEGLGKVVATGGEVAVGFASLLRALPGVDLGAIARAQIPVLADFASRTEGAWRARYQEWLRDMERLARR
jgi:Fe-S-cluster containining protein